MRPMLATAADPDQGLPKDSERWAYEVKWDGWRVLTEIHDGTVRLWSRSEREITPAFPELESLASVHPDVLLDGEIVILTHGVPHFTALADRIHLTDRRRASALAAKAPATLIAFDVLRMSGVDLTGRPWRERRAALEELSVQLSPIYEDVDVLLAATQEQGLEGVVAKRRSSVYRPGARSSDWRKLAHRRVQSVVIGGWRPEVNDRNQIGALLIGVWSSSDPDTRQLRFAGRMGSGLAAAGPQADLRRLLTPLKLDASPFDDAVPRLDSRGATWVEPRIVVDVRHLGRTENGRLRQPVFRGIRADLEAEDVRYE